MLENSTNTAADPIDEKIDLERDRSFGRWQPLISVVIPTHNRATMIRDALESVFAQTYKNWELIVVDDGSTDDTELVVCGFGSRIQYLRIARSGVSAARNAGIRASRGELVAFLDSDDIWLPSKLELQVRLFESDPDLGMVGGGCSYIDDAKQPLGSSVRGPGEISQEEFEIFTASPGSCSNEVVRRRVLDEVGGFNETLTRSQDRELWMRISRKYRVITVREPTVLKRVHTTTRPGVNFEVIRKCREQINETIANPVTRRKADAWMYYIFFVQQFKAGHQVLAVLYLLRSFATYPGRISPRNARLRPAAQRLIPPRMLKLLGGIYRRARKMSPEHSIGPL